MTSAFTVSPIPAELLLGGVEEGSLFRSRLGEAVLGGGGDTGRHGDIEGHMIKVLYRINSNLLHDIWAYVI